MTISYAIPVSYTHLCEVSPGIIWAGGYASGIFQITKKNGNIEYLTPAQAFHLNVRADKYIRDIKKDRYGCIWSGGYYLSLIHI